MYAHSRNVTPTSREMTTNDTETMVDVTKMDNTKEQERESSLLQFSEFQSLRITKQIEFYGSILIVPMGLVLNIITLVIFYKCKTHKCKTHKTSGYKKFVQCFCFSLLYHDQ